MRARTTLTVDIPDDEVRLIVDRYLESLKAGRYVRDGALWEDHGHHRGGELVIGNHEHDDYALVDAVQRLEDILRHRARS